MSADQPRPYETVVCSYTVTHGLTCCWHDDGRPSTRIVTLGNEDGACEHYVCTECGDRASEGDLPEQHSDQAFIDLRGRYRLAENDHAPTYPECIAPHCSYWPGPCGDERHRPAPSDQGATS